jgi:hypothetical protein
VPEVGETVTFNGSSSTPNGGALTSWFWDFDDGENDTGEIVTHDFDAAGTYDVTLTVTDSECQSSNITKTVTVETGEEPEPESQGTLKVEPENYTAIHNNETFDANVTIYDLNASARVVGIEFKLGYNTTLLEVLNVTEGPFMEAFAGEPHQGTLFMSWQISDYVLVDVLIFADENGTWHEPFPNGNGTVATITFRAIYQPSGVEKPCAACNLTLYDTKMGDPEANPIPHDSIDGYYEIVPTVIGDINYDGIVDIFDAIAFANCFGTRPGHPRWCPQADLNGDGIVDIFDAIIMANHFGEVAPTSCP